MNNHRDSFGNLYDNEGNCLNRVNLRCWNSELRKNHIHSSKKRSSIVSKKDTTQKK
jgi:hypothetical protein